MSIFFRRSLSLWFIMCLWFPVFSQDGIHWWNPEDAGFPVLEGQGWPGKTQHFYDRLPAEAEETVRDAVWNLGRHASGLKIKFRSRASEISVRYGVSGNHSMLHMPATGVSGVDLYAVDREGAWQWTGGTYKFGDTIRFHFSSLPTDYDREYHLYLPLYNKVEWLEIGVPEDGEVIPLPLSPDKPIAVYGTSIAQGGCASRPGKNWTALLERNLHTPLINLAFSGNGRLEKALTDLLIELDPKLYVLDCLPNMGRFPRDTIAERLTNTVMALREAKPEVPVLLVHHACATIPTMSGARQEGYERLNGIADSVFNVLKASGVLDIYMLTAEEIGLDMESTVDGVHPNDSGMDRYAEAYEIKIREVLNEPKGAYRTTRPLRQYRDFKSYDWNERHRRELELIRKNPPEIVFIGNSITHYWSGEPEEHLRRGEDSWSRMFGPARAQNLGYGWDRIENVLWRAYHGELDGYEARQILINIGTNNLSVNHTDEEIIAGLKMLVEAVKYRQPSAEILLTGIYPRRGMEGRIKILNGKIARLCGTENVGFADPGTALLNADGEVDLSLFADKGLHPNDAGYRVLGQALAPYILK